MQEILECIELRCPHASELIAQAEEWEDRAEVTQVDVDNNGKVKVVIADVGN